MAIFVKKKKKIRFLFRSRALLRISQCGILCLGFMYCPVGISCHINGYIFTPGANLTYLAPPPPGQFFMGAKSFIGTPEMQRFFVLKDKLNCTMKKCMVSMTTIKAILEHGGVHRILTISPLLLILDH